MSSTNNLLFINNSASSRFRYRPSVNLYVPRRRETTTTIHEASSTSGGDGSGEQQQQQHFHQISEDDDISISSSQVEENRQFIQHLKNWATATKASSKSATGKGIARLVEKIAHDGRVSIEDENLIIETISVQRGWWATLVVMDTLIVALATAMLCFEELTDNGHWSQTSKQRIINAYHTILAFLLYFSVCHLGTVLLISGLSTYLFEVKGIITFFVRCHTLLVHVNFTGMLVIVPSFLVVPVLAQMYSYGLANAAPCIALCFCAFLVVGGLYLRVIRPVFSGLYNEEYDIGSYGNT